MGLSKPLFSAAGCLLMMTLMGMAGVRAAEAQFGFLLDPAYAPQARSEEELDQYLSIITESNPKTTVKQVDLFASKYPQSNLLGIALQYQMMAYHQLNNFDGVLRAGERALQLQPHNVNTLSTLAFVIATRCTNQSCSNARLALGDAYAHESLQELTRMRIPREISLDRWKVMQSGMEARLHEALAYIATERGDPKQAVSEFRAAALGNPHPQGSQFYRLGMAYVLAGENGRAEEALRRAITLGPAPVRELAQIELRKLGARH